ncbi:MAG: NifU family protein [Myxococcales bacterium]|nr:NifU family protein [Myxococcales bacterium]
MDIGFRMHAERTPNPDSIKWVLSQPVAAAAAGAHFGEAPAPDASPLAAALFEVEGVVGVFLGPSFVTITKGAESEWTDLAQPVVDAIKAWAATGEPALGPGWVPPAAADEGGVVARILEVLDRDIRPFVAQDGGEIGFAGFRDGVVELVLQGACSGCPSSTITLKMGIEARLKEQIPEVEEVVAV